MASAHSPKPRSISSPAVCGPKILARQREILINQRALDRSAKLIAVCSFVVMGRGTRAVSAGVMVASGNAKNTLRGSEWLLINAYRPYPTGVGSY